MKIKLISLAVLILSVLGLSGCYDAYPGGYGYGGDPAPVYAGGYYPAGGWGNWGGWGPGYDGHVWDYNHAGWGDWNHGGWDRNHFIVPEHGGFAAHDFGSPRGGRGFDVAHNNAFRGGSGGGWHGGGGAAHTSARGASRGGGGNHASHSDRR
jgi:hypothetical protein